MAYLDSGYPGRVTKIISEELEETNEENNGNYVRLIEYGPEKSIKNSKTNEIKKLEDKQKDLNN
jgi:hypothetical protein